MTETTRIKTLKECLALPYGSMEHREELERWYVRFRVFCSRSSRSFIHEDIWDEVHKSSEVYNALREYNAKEQSAYARMGLI